MAISDTEKKYSFYRDYILNDKNTKKKILDLILAENVSKIIIGYPLNFKSEKKEISLHIENFSKELKSELSKNNLNTEIIFYDERFTSSLAQDNLIKSGISKKRRREKGIVDSISAQIILQDFLDSRNKK